MFIKTETNASLFSFVNEAIAFFFLKHFGETKVQSDSAFFFLDYFRFELTQEKRKQSH